MIIAIESLVSAALSIILLTKVSISSFLSLANFEIHNIFPLESKQIAVYFLIIKLYFLNSFFRSLILLIKLLLKLI